MNRSLAFGTFVGILIAAAIGYYAYVSKLVGPGARPDARPNTKLEASTPSATAIVMEPVDLPLTDVAESYSIAMKGRGDLLAHAASLTPKISVEAWQSSLQKDQDGNLITPPRASKDCLIAEPMEAVFLPAKRIEAIRSGRQNVVVVSPGMPKCLVASSTLALAYDDLLENRIAYRFGGTVQVERFIELSTDQLPDEFLQALEMSRDEFQAFFSIGNPTTTYLKPLLVMLVRYSETQPNRNPSEIPPFAAGAEVVSARTVTKLVKQGLRAFEPVLVDTRTADRFYGQKFRGALNELINVPFIPSKHEQTQFRLDFPYSFLEGSKVDLKEVVRFRDPLLVLFGQDENDPSPLWVLRELRLKAMRSIVIVRDGIKGLEKEGVRL